MTIFETTPQGRTTHPLGKISGNSAALLGAESSVDFSIGPDATPIEAMDQASTMVAQTLPHFMAGVPGANDVYAAVQAVFTELVDVTARHRADTDLVGRITYDGTHVIVSVGDMNRALPAPEEEPGLYLVHRVAADVGQYAGDMGGHITWAALEVRR